MDPSGNQLRSTDEYGNPIPGHGTTGFVDHHHNTVGFGEHETGGQGVLRRSGSSSSSSSEDDGFGGRRKKNKAGIKDKIKEKLPGRGDHKGYRNPQQDYGQGVAGGEHTHDHEKKGIIEKIKEKLPGSHNH